MLLIMGAKMKKILIIDDEISLLEALKDYLKVEGFDVYTSYNGEEGLKLFNIIQPDFVILDLMLPDITGEDICAEIRKKSDVPILMLTAKVEEEDKIYGLTLGADDYMTKPFSSRELAIRIKTILRRTEGRKKVDVKSFNNGDLEIDQLQFIVKKRGEELILTPTEFKILNLLVDNPNRVFSREQLINSALGFEYIGYERTIDTHIKNLRQKIEDDPKNPKYIITLYGIGYKFVGENV